MRSPSGIAHREARLHPAHTRHGREIAAHFLNTEARSPKDLSARQELSLLFYTYYMLVSGKKFYLMLV